MARKPQGDKNRARKRANRTKISLWSHIKFDLYNHGVLGYSLLIAPPMVPYNGIDTLTLNGLVPFIALGVFPATIILGIPSILTFIAYAVKVLTGAAWEAISQDVVSLMATFSRMDKSPQVLDRRIQLWLFIQYTVIDLHEDLKTLFRPNPGQVRWWLIFIVLLVLSVLSFVATVLAIPLAILTPDTIVTNLKVLFVATVWSLELLGAGKSFRYGHTLKSEFSFAAASIKADRVKALVNRVVLSPMKTVSMKRVEAVNMIAKLRGILRTFFRRDGLIASWGYILLTMCLLLIPAVIYSDFTPESTSANLNALYAAIVGSLIMIGMGNGKSYRTR